MKTLTRVLTILLMTIAILLPNIPMAGAAEVVQGPCLVFEEGKSVTLQNELDKSEITFDLAVARIGAAPDKGDVLRIAYQVKDGKNVALKVMNVTKQNLRKE